MTFVTTTDELSQFCESLKGADFIAIDTEFLRDIYYYPKLCLIQIATDDLHFAVDPLAENMDLSSLFALFNNKKIIKVFHSGKQDIEIIHRLSGKIPHPIFDTQIAAMVCGFGEAASYATLVEELIGKTIDKSSRFTDWSQRPLSKKQLDYALDDVIYLCQIYKKLTNQLKENNRTSWLEEEIANLANPDNYVNDPEEVWQRIKLKSNNPTLAGFLKSLARWRELKAQVLNRPRAHVIKDQVLLEIIATVPKTIADLKKIRGISKNNTELLNEILKALESSVPLTQKEYNDSLKARYVNHNNKPLREMLTVLLKMKCEQHNVAEKIVATSDDLKTIANSSTPKVPAMKGWRYEIFGKDAELMKQGKLALVVKGDKVEAVEVSS